MYTQKCTFHVKDDSTLYEWSLADVVNQNWNTGTVSDYFHLATESMIDAQLGLAHMQLNEQARLTQMNRLLCKTPASMHARSPTPMTKTTSQIPNNTRVIGVTLGEEAVPLPYNLILHLYGRHPNAFAAFDKVINDIDSEEEKLFEINMLEGKYDVRMIFSYWVSNKPKAHDETLPTPFNYRIPVPALQYLMHMAYLLDNRKLITRRGHMVYTQNDCLLLRFLSFYPEPPFYIQTLPAHLAFIISQFHHSTTMFHEDTLKELPACKLSRIMVAGGIAKYTFLGTISIIDNGRGAPDFRHDWKDVQDDGKKVPAGMGATFDTVQKTFVDIFKKINTVNKEGRSIFQKARGYTFYLFIRQFDTDHALTGSMIIDTKSKQIEWYYSQDRRFKCASNPDNKQCMDIFTDILKAVVKKAGYYMGIGVINEDCAITENVALDNLPHVQYAATTREELQHQYSIPTETCQLHDIRTMLPTDILPSVWVLLFTYWRMLGRKWNKEVISAYLKKNRGLPILDIFRLFAHTVCTFPTATFPSEVKIFEKDMTMKLAARGLSQPGKYRMFEVGRSVIHTDQYDLRDLTVALLHTLLSGYWPRTPRGTPLGENHLNSIIQQGRTLLSQTTEQHLLSFASSERFFVAKGSQSPRITMAAGTLSDTFDFYHLLEFIMRWIVQHEYEDFKFTPILAFPPIILEKGVMILKPSDWLALMPSFFRAAYLADSISSSKLQIRAIPICYTNNYKTIVQNIHAFLSELKTGPVTTKNYEVLRRFILQTAWNSTNGLQCYLEHNTTAPLPDPDSSFSAAPIFSR